MNIELIEQANTEISEYSPVAAGLAELKRKYGNVAVLVGTPKELEEAKRVRAEIREPRYECEKIRKALKAPALAHAKLIDTEAARITAELVAIEAPWDEAIKAEEARKETEKAAREAAERARVMAITERIAGIRQYVELVASCRTVERMQALKDKLAETSMDGFEEFEDEARQVWMQTSDKVQELMNAKVEQEAEQERIRAENQAAALKLEYEREQFRAQQAAAKVEADRLAAERLAQIAAEVEAQALKRKAEQDELTIQRAAFEAEAAEARAIVAAHRAKVLEAEKHDALAELDSVVEQAFSKTIADLVTTHEEEVKQAAEVVPPDATPDMVAAWGTAEEPSDADVAWTAISAVARDHNMTAEQATARLAAVQWQL